MPDLDPSSFLDAGGIGFAAFLVVVFGFVALRLGKHVLEMHDAREKAKAEHRRDLDKAELERRQAADHWTQELLERDRQQRVAEIETLSALVHTTNGVVEDNSKAMRETSGVINGVCEELRRDHRAIVEALNR